MNIIDYRTINFKDSQKLLAKLMKKYNKDKKFEIGF